MKKKLPRPLLLIFYIFFKDLNYCHIPLSRKNLVGIFSFCSLIIFESWLFSPKEKKKDVKKNNPYSSKSCFWIVILFNSPLLCPLLFRGSLLINSFTAASTALSRYSQTLSLASPATRILVSPQLTNHEFQTLLCIWQYNFP